MFAPHCSHCRSRVLLGTRRIVRAERTAGGSRSLVLRCHCGHLVVDDLGGAEPAVGAIRGTPAGGPQTARAVDAAHPRVAPEPVGPVSAASERVTAAA